MSRTGSASTPVTHRCSDVGNPIFSTRFLTESGMRPRRLLRSRGLFHTPCILRSARSEGTRLNSSHTVISYAVFCLKKKRIYSRNVKPYHSYTQHVPEKVLKRRTTA